MPRDNPAQVRKGHRSAAFMREVRELQADINSGIVWLSDSPLHRKAVRALKYGICVLGRKSFTDWRGVRIPSRHEVQHGTMGSTYFVAKIFGGSYAERMRNVPDPK